MPWLLQAKGGDAEALKVGLAAAEFEADVTFEKAKPSSSPTTAVRRN